MRSALRNTLKRVQRRAITAHGGLSGPKLLVDCALEDRRRWGCFSLNTTSYPRRNLSTAIISSNPSLAKSHQYKKADVAGIKLLNKGILLSQSSSFSPSSFSPSHQAPSRDDHLAEARRLLDEHVYPKGSWTSWHAVEAKHVLNFFKQEKSTDAESVNLSIALLERMVAEKAASKEGIQSKWICDLYYFTPLFNLWKQAAIQGQRVVSPRDLVQKLQAMSRTLPEFRYDIVILNIIMEVMIKQTPPQKVPFVAEDLLNFIRKEAADTKTVELRPNVFTYNRVMQAWAVSGLPQASEKIDSLLGMMRREEIVPDMVTFSNLLRYWGGRGQVDKIETLLDTMKNKGVKPDRTSWTAAIYSYAKVGNTEKAERLLQEMLRLQPKNEREARMVAESTQNILAAYRKIVDDANVHRGVKDRAVECAGALYENITTSSQFSDEEQSKNVYLHVLYSDYGCAVLSNIEF